MIATNVVIIKEIHYSYKKCSYLKPSGKTYCLRDCGHGVLMLYIEMEGWSPTEEDSYEGGKEIYESVWI